MKAVALLLVATLGCGPLKAVLATAPGQIAECFRDQHMERSVSSVLSSGSEGELDRLAESSTIEKVACALWAVVRSIGAASQDDGELSVGQREFGVARRPDDQPKLDTALKWLKRHGQQKEPDWPAPKFSPSRQMREPLRNGR